MAGLVNSLSALPLRSPAVNRRVRGQSTDRRRDGWGRPFVVNEDLFRSALIRERKRADRFDQPFLLMLVTIPPGETPDAASTRAAVVQALSAAKRDTDVLGWFDQAATLGVILPEIDGADSSAAAPIETRVWRELAAALDAQALAACTIRVHAYSADAANDWLPFDPAANDARSRLRAVVKRGLDVLGSLALLALFSPAFLIIAALVRLTSAGPVFFRQLRIGQNGKPFTMLKFRTMRVDATAPIHQQYVTEFIGSTARPLAGEDVVFKMVNDPRVNPIGRWLRQASLDELPQFWNVLRGEMSLVGPRPPLQYEVEQYKRWHYRRVLEAKPGVTGLWQVTGRSRTTFEDMVRLDLRYARNRSLLTDLRILLATPRAVISRKGAC